MIPAREASDEQMTVNVTQTETVPNNSIDDLYAKFEAEQKNREIIWRANQAAKRTKTPKPTCHLLPPALLKRFRERLRASQPAGRLQDQQITMWPRRRQK